MKPSIPTAAVTAVLALGAISPVRAQAPQDLLPPGPGKDAVMHVCTACHGAEQFAYARYTPEGWDNEISKMESAGAEMSPEEKTAISAYLATHLSKSPPPEPDGAKPPPPSGGPEG